MTMYFVTATETVTNYTDYEVLADSPEEAEEKVTAWHYKEAVMGVYPIGTTDERTGAIEIINVEEKENV